MAYLYEVKKSPGKGLGVFATKPIQPGTVIVRDRVVMKIKRPEHDVTDKQVETAFKTLKKSEKALFVKLHEGDLPYKTQLQRIYKSNAFGDEVHAWLYLKIARVNHSCAPNAEITDTHDETDVKVVASKPIAKDEEILISYFGALEEGSKDERAEVMKETYGFECHCAVCMLEGTARYLSDGRRRLINALCHKLEGFEPTHLQSMKNVNGTNATKGAKVLGRYKRRLRTPLTTQEKTAYNFLKAKLLETEAMLGYELAKSYVEAAMYLLCQMKEQEVGEVLPSALVVNEWLAAACKVMGSIREPKSKDVMELQQACVIVKKSPHMRLLA